MKKLFETEESDIPVYKTLYKKTSTGAIQEWNVQVVYSNVYQRAEIIYKYGQLDSEKIQTTNDFITKGKNIGKQNETSIIEQAIVEAQAKWEKQKKKGYVESIQDAEAGKIDDIIKGGINPMLAHKYINHFDKIEFPALGQPKLDGHRCTALIDENGKCTIWSRTRKKITSMIHIEQEIEKTLGQYKGLILDGELYNHEYKSDFEQLSSAIRKKEQPENYHIIQYHIYDCIIDGPFSDRTEYLKKILPAKNKFLKRVETVAIKDFDDNKRYYQHCMDRGYEGSMIRNAHGKYENKRSYHLQKVKKFDDAEFPIVGIEKEGKGKLRGHVGSFSCKAPNGNIFGVKMKGKTEKLKEYFENHDLWKGKKLTVQFQGWTTKSRVPRFPSGVRLREDI